MNVVVGLMIGAALAIALLQLGPLFVGPLADFVLAAVLISLAGFATFALVAYFARHVILGKMRLRADARLADVRTPLLGLVQATEQRDPTKAATSAVELSTVLLSWHSEVRLMQAIVGGLTGLLALFAAILGSSLLVKQNELLSRQNDLVIVQNQLVEAQRRASLVFELGNVLDKIDEERDAYALHGAISECSNCVSQGRPNPGVPVNDTMAFVTRGASEGVNSRLKLADRPRRRDYSENAPLFILSDRLSGRIAALSRSLKPYRFLDDQQRLSPTALSPERGQLLLSLLSSDVDMFELNHFRPVFDRADLANLELSNMPVEHLLAREANFAGARLSKVAFAYSNLEGSNFADADLRGVSFSTLNGACLRGTVLYGSSLPELRYADLSNADIAKAQFKDLSHAVLSGVKGWRDVAWNGVRLFNVQSAPPEMLAYASSKGATLEADAAREKDVPHSRRGCAIATSPDATATR